MGLRGKGDAEVVRRTLAGNREAFGILVERYGRVVYAVCFSHVRNHADAEEASQDTFVRAFQGLGGLRDAEKFKQWLVSVARHVALNLVERRRREAQLDFGGGIPVKDLRLELEDRERGESLRSMVAALSEDHCNVLTLHYFAGQSTEEIAELLGLSRESALDRVRGRNVYPDRRVRRSALTAKAAPQAAAKTHRPTRPATGIGVVTVNVAVSEVSVVESSLTNTRYTAS
ncbi:MAG: hypothetical protein QG656_2325 [Candidatus Hydrogenedentes bacterium]|nr:hypothetical protein [Candidatus Hydrogenedentota bacterium]